MTDIVVLRHYCDIHHIRSHPIQPNVSGKNASIKQMGLVAKNSS